MLFPRVMIEHGRFHRPSFNAAPLDVRLSFLGTLWDAVRDLPARLINLNSTQCGPRETDLDTEGVCLGNSDLLLALQVGYSTEFGMMMDTENMRCVRSTRFMFAEGGLSNFLFKASNPQVRMHFGGAMKSELLARIMVVAWLLEQHRTYTESLCKNEWNGAETINRIMRNNVAFQKFAMHRIETATDCE